MNKLDYYNILELPFGASDDDIKKSYRKLALKYHPDKNQNDAFAVAKFLEITEAYNSLLNSDSRNPNLLGDGSLIENISSKNSIVWWKILSALIILYTLVWGMLNPVPHLDILNETIRNVYFHVPIWFAMIFQMGLSVFYAIQQLNKNDLQLDLKSNQAAQVGLFFSFPGLLTGSMWAKFTWGTWWTFQDPKLNGVAIAILIYLAYFILRSSIDDELKRARISSVYNIFAFVMMFVFIMILPRLTDSLHPGNPAFGKYDLDSNMRMVFYPAVIGWVLLSLWVLDIKTRLAQLTKKYDET
jgi:heme exporter protein C